jgi:hypothetical protein
MNVCTRASADVGVAARCDMLMRGMADSECMDRRPGGMTELLLWNNVQYDGSAQTDPRHQSAGVVCTRSGSSLVVFWGVARGNRDPIERSPRSTVILPLTPHDTLNKILFLPRLLVVLEITSISFAYAVFISLQPCRRSLIQCHQSYHLHIWRLLRTRLFFASTRSACSFESSKAVQVCRKRVQSLSI